MDKFLEERNPSKHFKHLSNHTVYSIPASPWHHLDTRAAEIDSVKGAVGRGWQPAQLSAPQPCLTSVGPVLQVSKTSTCSRNLLTHPAAKIHVPLRAAVEGLNLSPTNSQGCDISVHTRSLAGTTSAWVFLGTGICSWAFHGTHSCLHLDLWKSAY